MAWEFISQIDQPITQMDSALLAMDKVTAGVSVWSLRMIQNCLQNVKIAQGVNSKCKLAISESSHDHKDTGYKPEIKNWTHWCEGPDICLDWC